ncbi:glycosyltransferase [Devosia beringensis]|uniref:glycosyltransferase n=1 Tax=Devosia beringensis TaxID=2657486 RepID=UPI00186B63E3|nr:glycosyltransferase [Devosia beringensis]
MSIGQFFKVVVIVERKSIVFLINSIAGGGAERVMMRLIDCSREQLVGYDFHLVLLDIEEEAYAIPDWVTVHRLNSRKRTLSSIKGLWILLRKLRPRLVLSFLTRANIANVIVAKLLGHCCVISERANTSAHHAHGMVGRLSKLLIRQCYSRADAVIAVAAGIADDLVSNYDVRRDSVHVIANPVDAATIQRLAAEPSTITVPRPYIVGMGRFVRSKNFALLLDAFAGSKLDGFDLVVMGQGPLEKDLRDHASDIGLGARVHFPGFLANPFPVIAGAYAYVLPSNGEGFPNGLVEAMVTGVPVIATDCPSGPAEILDYRAEGQITKLHGGKHGLLVPMNDKAAMIDALNCVIQPGERDRLATAASTGAARYGLERAVARYWDVITHALTVQGARR